MSSNFPAFQDAFFHIFEQPQFDGQTFLHYLQKSNRSGDEASVVDNAISGPLLGLRGFSSGEQNYNAVKSDLSRPDYALRVPEVGACFMVEDKSTSLELEAKWRAQLAGYVRGAGVSLGLLCNGRKMQLWEFTPKTERQLLSLDIAALLELRKAKLPLDEKQSRDLESLFDLLRREAFTEAKNLAARLAVDADTWRQNARKLGEEENAEDQLVEDLKQLVAQLHRDARRQLDGHLDAALELKKQLRLADDKGENSVEQAIKEARAFVDNALLGFASREEILEFLALYAQDSRGFPSREFFIARVLEIHNRSLVKPLKNLGDNLNGALETFAEVVLSIHARQTRLKQKAHVALAVEADFTQWKDLVSETMLGDLSKTKNALEADDAQRAEFALQAAYVVFIRLLIRVCEDKDIFPDRFLSNGGLLFWQENIRRYLQFVRGNRYDPLLKMAYDNAANIYALEAPPAACFSFRLTHPICSIEAAIFMKISPFFLVGGVWAAASLAPARAQVTPMPQPAAIASAPLAVQVRWLERFAMLPGATAHVALVAEIGGETGLPLAFGAARVGAGGADLSLNVPQIELGAAAKYRLRVWVVREGRVEMISQSATNYLRDLNAPATVIVRRVRADNPVPLPRPVSDSTYQLRGEVGKLDRRALSEDARVEVEVRDVSRQDVASKLIGKAEIELAGRQLPVAYDLTMVGFDLDPRGRYAVSAKVYEAGKVTYATDTFTAFDSTKREQNLDLRVVAVP